MRHVRTIALAINAVIADIPFAPPCHEWLALHETCEAEAPVRGSGGCPTHPEEATVSIDPFRSQFQKRARLGLNGFRRPE